MNFTVFLSKILLVWAGRSAGDWPWAQMTPRRRTLMGTPMCSFISYIGLCRGGGLCVVGGCEAGCGKVTTITGTVLELCAYHHLE